MATRAASKRLAKEAQMMDKDPPPFCYARPREDNVLDWHFILRGPPDTPYHGGEYWGQLLFPPEYPFKPPGIKVSTPSGRFHTDTKICTSMSDFHPGSWNPAWSVTNILVGLLSFMCSDDMTTGSVMATHADRCTLAQRSHAFNIKQPRFKKIFPDYCAEMPRDLPNMGEKCNKAEAAQQSPSSAVAGATEAMGPAATAASPRGSLTQSTSAALRSRQTQPQVARPGEELSKGSGTGKDAMTRKPAPQNQLNPQGQGNEGAAGRSRAIFPILLALAAYLFLSRMASSLGGTSSGIGGTASGAGSMAG